MKADAVIKRAEKLENRIREAYQEVYSGECRHLDDVYHDDLLYHVEGANSELYELRYELFQNGDDFNYTPKQTIAMLDSLIKAVKYTEAVAKLIRAEKSLPDSVFG